MPDSDPPRLRVAELVDDPDPQLLELAKRRKKKLIRLLIVVVVFWIVVAVRYVREGRL